MTQLTVSSEKYLVEADELGEIYPGPYWVSLGCDTRSRLVRSRLRGRRRPW